MATVVWTAMAHQRPVQNNLLVRRNKRQSSNRRHLGHAPLTRDADQENKVTQKDI